MAEIFPDSSLYAAATIAAARVPEIAAVRDGVVVIDVPSGEVCEALFALVPTPADVAAQPALASRRAAILAALDPLDAAAFDLWEAETVGPGPAPGLAPTPEQRIAELEAQLGALVEALGGM